MSETTSKPNDDTKTTWDLTTTLSPYLDLHMMFPLLEFVDDLICKQILPYESSDVATARLSLLHPTNMVDYAMDIYKELHDVDDPPTEMEEMKAKIFEELERLRSGCKTFDALCCDENKIRTKLTKGGQWNVEYLTSNKKEYNVDMKTIETYRQLGKFNYDCGDYSSANKMLECYHSLFANFPQQQSKQEQDDMDVDNEGKKETTAVPEGNPNMYYLKDITLDLLQVLWGRLSCEILLENWDESAVALTAVKTAMETLVKKNALTPLEALEQRTWLLHWSLFVFWNITTSNKNGLQQLIDLFFSERYLQAITTNTPHLLRYLTAAVLLSKRLSSDNNKRLIKDLIRVMSHCDYTDPIVDFVDCLCIKFNFELAQEKLTQCEEVLQQDFFLCKQTALFMEEARIFIFENYCRIHNKIDLDVLSEKLAMETNAAERWIVDLIRSVSLDAKIDSEERCVVMGCGEKNVCEMVMEKMKDLNVRSGVLVGNMGSVISEVKKRKEKISLIEDDEY